MDRRAILGTLLIIFLVAGGPMWAAAAEGPWYASYERALRAQARGEWKESLRHLEDALAKKPEPQAQARTYGLRFVNYLPYFHMGLANYRLGNKKKAIANIERSEALGESSRLKDTRQRLQRITKALTGRGRLSDREVDEMVPSEPPATPGRTDGDKVPWYVLYEAGVAYVESGDWASAIGNLERAAALDGVPRQYARTYGVWFVSYLPYYYLGVASYRQEVWGDATRHLEKSESEGVVQNFEAEYAKLKTLLREARKHVRSDEEATRSRAVTHAVDREITEAVKLFNEQAYDQSEEKFRAILTLDPYNSVAKSYLQRLREVTRDEQEREENHLMAGTRAVFQGDYEAAIELLEAAKAFHNDDANLHAYLGAAYTLKHLSDRGSRGICYNRAVEEFARALQIDPSYEIDGGAFSSDVIDVFRRVKDKR